MRDLISDSRAERTEFLSPICTLFAEREKRALPTWMENGGREERAISTIIRIKSLVCGFGFSLNSYHRYLLSLNLTYL